MSLKPYQEKMLAQMIELENLLARLYALFAERFPTHGDFWQRMAHEEQQHAAMIEKLKRGEKLGRIVFDEGKTRTYTLTVFISHLETLVATAREGTRDLKWAFAQAIDVESSLIEKNLFQRFAADSESNRNILKRLHQETEGHLERLKAARRALA